MADAPRGDPRDGCACGHIRQAHRHPVSGNAVACRATVRRVTDPRRHLGVVATCECERFTPWNETRRGEG